ncbi:hypothetical protein vBYenSP400_10 [Yersinia phage vB_YenS_P400]|nr:hypothetical protein vBYenSP400_10 [Yersinia phage vB_YenS_P400]
MIYLNIFIYAMTMIISYWITGSGMTQNQIMILSTTMIMLCIKDVIDAIRDSTK